MGLLQPNKSIAVFCKDCLTEQVALSLPSVHIQSFIHFIQILYLPVQRVPSYRAVFVLFYGDDFSF